VGRALGENTREPFEQPTIEQLDVGAEKPTIEQLDVGAEKPPSQPVPNEPA
jgi:hypothetical protein